MDVFVDLTLAKQANTALKAGNIHGALTLLERFITETFSQQPSDDQRVAAAWMVLKADYIQALEEAVDSIRTDYCQGTYAGNQDEFHQDIGHVASSYTMNESAAQMCLLFSDNANGVPWIELAYHAFRTDMQEELKSSGVDLGLTPPESDEIAIECEACGEYRVALPGEDTCNSCREDAGNEQCYECHAWHVPEVLNEDDLCAQCVVAKKEEEECSG